MNSPLKTLVDFTYLVIKDVVSHSSLFELTNALHRVLSLQNETNRIASKSLGRLVCHECYPEIQNHNVSYIPIHVVEDLFGKDYLRHDIINLTNLR